MNESEARQLLARLVAGSSADSTEALLFAGTSSLTRFSNNEIHQNVSEENSAVSIRAILGRRSGQASTNDLSEVSLAGALQRALEVASHSPEDPDFVDLAGAAEVPPFSGSFAATRAFNESRRADAVAEATEVAQAAGASAAGAVSCSDGVIAIANSKGLDVATAVTEGQIKVAAKTSTSSGFASQFSRDTATLDPRAIAATAVENAIHSQNPRELPAGRYYAILEPAAVADMLSALAYVGFSAQAVQEGRSFMTHRLGERVMGENISIWDDALDPRTVGLPFDFEGTPKQKTEIVRDGVAKGPVYDRRTAAKDGKSSTGHGLPYPNPSGPLPFNLFLAPGDDSAAELAHRLNRGILVSRFHYTNIEDPVKTKYTGTTRDGTFYVEDGHIVHAVRNLRFTEEILSMLGRVLAVSSDPALKDGFFGMGYCCVPALLVEGFNITGAQSS